MSGRALVTGGTGYVGRRVVRRLLDAGWAVTSLSLPGEDAPADWDGRIRSTHADLADAATLDAVAAVGEADLVVHLAAPVGVAGRYAWQWQVMVGGTEALVDRMRPGARLVLASSIAVYGDRIQSGTCREDTPFGAFQGAYGRAKQGQEAIAGERAAARGVALSIVRPANVYGLGGGGAWGDRLLDLIRATGGAVIGDGEANDAGLVHVETWPTRSCSRPRGQRRSAAPTSSATVPACRGGASWTTWRRSRECRLRRRFRSSPWWTWRAPTRIRRRSADRSTPPCPRWRG